MRCKALTSSARASKNPRQLHNFSRFSTRTRGKGLLLSATALEVGQASCSRVFPEIRAGSAQAQRKVFALDKGRDM
jgi:hypothetical protein